MKTKILATMIACCASLSAWSQTGMDEQNTVKKDPASGFWTCNGIRMHMGVDLTSWQNLSDGDMFLRTTPPEPENNKAVAVHGMAYTFSSTKNPAVSKFFLIDKSGKKLYMYDDLEFSKLHPCKRDQ
ncbi:hypothetical protein HP277_000453 [Salmonella enterica]|nr:hypothetical protein [Salmonella enterica]EDK0373682.1 hypothetical protein [Salmonella enterica]EFP3442014.1 hypothetical protein [Salmonella enterica]EGK8508510.1 hypothetical protein [Salmonella enterica]EJE6978072.1 hypothetical protein [Salmonella enterica]